MSSEPKTFTREEFYNEVWSAPMVKLANKFGFSDVGLAKLCKKHQIPRPPRGYWAKLEFGKAPPKPPLPECADPALAQIDLNVAPVEEQQKREQDAKRAKQSTVVYDAEITELLNRAKALPKIEMPDALRSPHPLVKITQQGFKEVLASNYHHSDPLYRPSLANDRHPLSVEVGKESIQRALLFFDTLIKTLERIGCTVAVHEQQYPSSYKARNQTSVKFANAEVVVLRLRERYRIVKDSKQDSWHRSDFVPTGLFVLDEGPALIRSREFGQDEKDRRIEDSINKIIIRILELAGRERIKLQVRQRQREIQERQEAERKAAEAEIQRQRAELKKRYDEEKARVERLFYEADCWRKTQNLRGYIQAVAELAGKMRGPIELGSDMAKWVSWANLQADRLDPLLPSPPSVLDEGL